MRTQQEVEARLAELDAAIAKGPDNDLQESMWPMLLGEAQGLRWVLGPELDRDPQIGGSQ